MIQPAHRRLNGRAVFLLLVLAAVAMDLIAHFEVKTWSDPAKWYVFALDFPRQFATSKLVYGYPLVLWTVMKVSGPYWIFLINIPILLGLVICLYAFSGRLQESEPEGQAAAELVPALTVLLFYLAARFTMRDLTALYRDPLSFVFLVLSYSAALRAAYGDRRRCLHAGLSGMCLALAASVRETSILAAAPMCLFILVHKFRNREWNFVRPAVCFMLALVVFCIPLAVQNAQVSGSAVVPAYSAPVVDAAVSAPETKTVDDWIYAFSGVHVEDFFANLPKIWAYLAGHFGVLLLLALAGAVLAVKRRHTAMTFLLLPSFALYAVYYTCYSRVVARYLFVLDLFLAPLAAYGGAWIITGILRLVRAGAGKTARSVTGVHVLVVAAVFVTAFRGCAARTPEARFGVQDARRFQRDLSARLGAVDYVLAERPLEGLLRCFTDASPQVVHYLSPQNVLRDPDVYRLLREQFARREELYLLCYSDGMKDYFRRDFHLDVLDEFTSADYSLQDVLGAESFTLYQLQEWTTRVLPVRLSGRPQSASWLAVDFSNLSKHERTYCRVKYGDLLLDEHPMDGLNYYGVSAGTEDESLLLIESDGPLPDNIAVALKRMDDPIEMDFTGDRVIPHWSRLVSSSRESPEHKYPVIRDSMDITIPTVHPEWDAFYVVAASVGLESPQRQDTAGLVVSAGGRRLLSEEVRKEKRRGGWWQDVSFVIKPSDVKGAREVATTWKLTSAGPLAKLMLRSLSVYRVEESPERAVAFGTVGDGAYVVRGFHAREQSSAVSPPHWRWTEGESRIRLLLDEGQGPLLLEIDYRADTRPEDAPASAPKFSVNNVPLSGQIMTNGSLVTAVFEVPAEIAADSPCMLTITNTTWSPVDYQINSDSRQLGLMLHSIRARRL